MLTTTPSREDFRARARRYQAKIIGFGVGDNSATLNVFDGATETVEGIGKFAGFRNPDGNRIWLLDYSIEHGES